MTHKGNPYMRYRVGFEHPETKCDWSDRNPGFFEVVDTQGIGALGTVVALVDGESMAHRIVEGLNREGKMNLEDEVFWFFVGKGFSVIMAEAEAKRIVAGGPK